MSELRHVVIFAYILEIAFFSALVARLGAVRQAQRLPLALAGLMVVRLLVKLVYFYVEFYITSWHLNILFNALMDTTYVLSQAGVLACAARACGTAFPLRRVFTGAAVSYVAGFFLISVLWVDPASNHDIRIALGAPQVLYSLNELLFLAVALIAVVRVARCARASKDGGPATFFACAAVVFYAVYIYLWDMSFLVPGLDAMRLIKPVDGVLLFAALVGAALHVLVGSLEPAAPADADGTPAADEGRSRVEAATESWALTKREAEVLALLTQGKTVAQIAEELSVSEHTAKRHVSNIYRKADVHSRYELMGKVWGTE